MGLKGLKIGKSKKIGINPNPIFKRISGVEVLYEIPVDAQELYNICLFEKSDPHKLTLIQTIIRLRCLRFLVAIFFATRARSMILRYIAVRCTCTFRCILDDDDYDSLASVFFPSKVLFTARGG